MKRLLFIPLLFIVSGLFAQSQFQTTVGGTGFEEGYSIVQTTDEGYVIAGQTTFYGAGGFDIYVVKLDYSGTLQWTRTIGGSGNDWGNGIVKSADGYAVAGYTTSFGAGNADVYVAKLDTTGALQWTRTIGGAGDDRGWGIASTSDGGYAVAAYSASFGAGDRDLYVVKLDSIGTIQWTRTVGGANRERGHHIVQTTDGGYAVTGSSISFGAGGSDVYLVKLDSSGMVQWTRTVGGTADDRSYGIVHTTDGGYAIAGETHSFGAGDADLYVVKLDSIGVLQWTSTVGGANPDWGWGIVQTTDEGYVISGWTASFGSKYYIVKLDSTGAVQWTRTVGGVSGDGGYGITQTADAGYAVTGGSFSFGAGGKDVYVVKLDSSGNTCGNQGTGGTASSGGISGSGGVSGSGGIPGSGGNSGSGGTDDFCPCATTTSSISPIVCDSFISPSGNYLWTISGTYTDIISNAVGCDSVMTIVLIVDSNYTTDSISIVQGDSILLGGAYQTTAGIYYDTLTATNGCDSIIVTTLIVIVGIAEQGNTNQITIHPNPTTGHFTIQGATGEIQIFDLFGRLVLSTNKSQIDMSAYPAGIYFVRTEQAARKLILQ